MPPEEIKIRVYWAEIDENEITIDEESMREEFEQKLKNLCERYHK